MSINFGTFLLVVVILAIVLFFLDQIKKKNQIYCTFRRRNKTRIEKFVPLKSKYVIFEGGKYRVDPRRIQLYWWDRGLLGMFKIGFWVPSLDFRWDTDQPLDPDDFTITLQTPEARAVETSEEDFRHFSEHAQPTGAKKESAIIRFLPWIALIAAIAAIFIVWQLRGDIANLYQLLQVK